MRKRFSPYKFSATVFNKSMNDDKSQIIDKIASKGDGMIVPGDYFADFATKMSASLPFREELDVPAQNQKRSRNSTWLRMRPYVYMAAMFAGAWCLIKMFSLMSPSTSNVSIDNFPSLSLALEDEQFVDEYVIDGVSTYDILENSYLDTFGSAEDNEYVFQEPDMAQDDTSGDATVEPAYILPTDGDYSTPPYN